ncbi:MAG: DNA/RNA non-specific endonuclease [Polyangiaceae bacterium]
MTAPRSRRAPGRSLVSTFVCVVLLLLVARVALVECGSGALPKPSSASSHSSTAHRAQTTNEPPSPPNELPPASTDLAASVHLALGIPKDADPSDDHLLDERAYVVSYSPVKHVPNWVAWRLDRSNLGHVKRKNDFRPDPSLPSEFYHVTERDYVHSGFDRGHMCPSADREDTAEDNSLTFLFTNMQPQLHELNAGPWERLEEYERQRAEQGDVLYIVAGGVFSAPFPTIGQGVAVPAANFKIIVALRPGQKPADISTSTDILAVLMPNERGVGEHTWSEFLTSVDALEQASGYDFLNAIPEPIQRVLEARTAHP